MASIGKQHQELDEQGIGKCSVPEDNTSLPMEYIIRHGIGVSVPAPHPAPEPEESPELAQAVEQSENKQDCPSRLGDVVERLSNFPEPVEQGEPTCEVLSDFISCRNALLQVDPLEEIIKQEICKGRDAGQTIAETARKIAAAVREAKNG